MAKDLIQQGVGGWLTGTQDAQTRHVARSTAQYHLESSEGVVCIENSSELVQEPHFSPGQLNIGETLLQFL